MIILYFVLGGFYSILLLAVGFYMGYIYESTNGKVDKSKKLLKNPFDFGKDKRDDAGPVKPITKLEREAEAQKGFRDRVRELTTN